MVADDTPSIAQEFDQEPVLVVGKGEPLPIPQDGLAGLIERQATETDRALRWRHRDSPLNPSELQPMPTLAELQATPSRPVRASRLLIYECVHYIAFPCETTIRAPSVVRNCSAEDFTLHKTCHVSLDDRVGIAGCGMHLDIPGIWTLTLARRLYLERPNKRSPCLLL